MLHDKVALVTGGALGIGRAAAVTLAGHGATVLVADIDAAEGEKTCALAEATGGHAEFVHCDVTDPTSVAALVGTAVERHGRLDCAVNNAGTEGVIADIVDYPIETFDRVLALNLRAVFTYLQQELAVMVPRGCGSVVNVSSIAGFAGFSAYNASKHGVVGLTRTAALEMRRQVCASTRSPPASARPRW
ncbi:SDR family NAD(P)-dependent oxidoreductase [Pseudonocardia kujensis]|nr:SDR family NAD(P)-dependent oxidoreductase [Pseudonocardia kujensis]MCE0764102.1 SDR family NAD(P)-dependent oxidoreductase [Pseudonocardia kujensis]